VISQKPTKILVIDDDLRLRILLNRYLTEQGFSVLAVSDGMSMNNALAREHFDLLILDLMLPDENGLDICKRLRGAGNDIPLLMLTAKGDDMDRIIGLELGADDYLPKPFNPRELVARIHAILRRRLPAVPGAPAVEEKVIAFGTFQLNLATRQLAKDGQAVALSTGEFSVLHVLVAHPRLSLTREKLMDLARGREHGANDRSIDVQISRLRKMIEVDPVKPRYIQTVWNVGYVFVPDGGAP
jgi:two-component system, OmpR family, phosphate regulon response regulator OmpR